MSSRCMSRLARRSWTSPARFRRTKPPVGPAQLSLCEKFLSTTSPPPLTPRLLRKNAHAHGWYESFRKDRVPIAPTSTRCKHGAQAHRSWPSTCRLMISRRRSWPFHTATNLGQETKHKHNASLAVRPQTLNTSARLCTRSSTMRCSSLVAAKDTCSSRQRCDGRGVAGRPRGASCALLAFDWSRCTIYPHAASNDHG